MKWLLIMILIPFTVCGQVNDTTSQMIYYQKSLIKRDKVELYGYTSYDLWWADESGMGISITIPNRRKEKKRKNRNGYKD
jgi:hypothetical protein